MGSGGRSRAAAGTISPTLPAPAGNPVPPAAAAYATSGSTGRPAGGFGRGGSANLGGGAPFTGTGAAAAEAATFPATPPDVTGDVLTEATAARVGADTAREMALVDWPGQPEVSYLNDPEAFQAAYEEALARKERGEDPVPYMTEDATGGLGARDGGRAFGVEIEFDVEPGVNRNAAVTAIGRDLYDAGLTDSPYQRGYHSGGAGRFSDQHSRGWRFETDSTVHGEIVSPIMYDEPQTWRNLAKVCEIVRRHGGTATARTGGHVHVSAGDYDHTVENHNRLLQATAAYEDTMYRLAQNPARDRHRGRSWCTPNQTPANGYRDIYHARIANGHGTAVNFSSVAGTRSDHIEFRMWDGSLNPGVIQAQVNVSLGLTAAAARGNFQPPATEPVGTHASNNENRRRLRGQAWRESTRSVRQLADTIFRRSAQSAQVTSLFAVTRWQRA